MPERNQEVFEMINQVRARLKDLENELAAHEGEVPGFAEKLDRIDDKVYMLVSELESKAAGAAEKAPSQQEAAPEAAADGTPAAKTNEDADDDGGMNILTPEAKQKLGETVGDMRELGKDAAAALSELNEAFSDITEPFKAFTKPRRRF